MMQEAEQTYRKKIAEAAKQTTGDVLPSHRLKEVDKLSTSSQPQRAQQNGIGIVMQKKLDRLARDLPPLHEEVKAGNLSVHRASIQRALSVKLRREYRRKTYQAEKATA